MGFENSEKIPTKNALKFIFSYVKRHVWYFVFGIATLVVVDLVQVKIPEIIRQMTDSISVRNFSESVILQGFLHIIGLTLLMVMLRIVWRLLIIGSANRIEKEIRLDMYEQMQRLSFNYFNKTKIGDLMALMINDVKQLRMAAGPAFIAIVDAIFMGPYVITKMFMISPKVTLICIIPFPIIAVIILKFGPMIRNRFSAVQQAFATVSSNTQEVFSGIRVVKGFKQEEAEGRNFEENCQNLVDKHIDLIKVFGVFFPSITLLANLAIALLLLVGGRLVIVNDITIGTFIEFTMLLNMLVWPMMAIGWVFNIYQRGLASAKRILTLVDQEPEIKDSIKTNKKIKEVKGDIKIKNLSFKYNNDSPNILDDIRLEIPKGSSLGIMGKPGSGKSTLISILFHLFNVEDGKIEIDGYDINSIPLKSLRRSIGYVPQSSFLFSDTVENNIAYSRSLEEEYSDDVIDASRRAGVYDDIMEFTNGFETTVGERGVTLSGGQKQRVSIARAILKDPNILILDDALSAVDASTEKKILGNIKKEIKGKTSIIIAHRVSTVKDCDNIIILEDGKITEQGSHEDLLRNDGYYKRLYDLQKIEDEFEN